MADILVHLPEGLRSVREYAVRFLFEYRLGMTAKVEFEEREDILVKLGNGRSVSFPDVFFRKANDAWLKEDSLPKTAPSAVHVPEGLPSFSLLSELPVIFSDNGELYLSKNYVRIPIDILGTIFFFISRYEEHVTQSVDSHGRFPADSSYAGKHGLLEVPIVDFYVLFIAAVFTDIMGIEIHMPQKGGYRLTHDVDRPFGAVGLSIKQLIKKCAGDLVIRRNLPLALRRCLAWILPRKVGYRLDPNNQFPFMLEKAEQAGLRAFFYFMVDRTSDHDPGYDIEDPLILELIKEIRARGHSIGLHPSYGSLGDQEQLAREVGRLRAAMDKVGIDQEEIGGRHHYLRWDARFSWDHWEAAGLAYDSSVGFAAEPGFRAGTGFPFPCWSFLHERQLDLVEYPLILMEQTLLSSVYKNLGLDDVCRKFEELQRITTSVGSELTVLWHNDALITSRQRRAYETILRLRS